MSHSERNMLQAAETPSLQMIGDALPLTTLILCAALIYTSVDHADASGQSEI